MFAIPSPDKMNSSQVSNFSVIILFLLYFNPVSYKDFPVAASWFLIVDIIILDMKDYAI